MPFQIRMGSTIFFLSASPRLCVKFLSRSCSAHTRKPPATSDCITLLQSVVRSIHSNSAPTTRAPRGVCFKNPRGAPWGPTLSLADGWNPGFQARQIRRGETAPARGDHATLPRPVHPPRATAESPEPPFSFIRCEPHVHGSFVLVLVLVNRESLIVDRESLIANRAPARPSLENLRPPIASPFLCLKIPS